jgi:glycosyltransferase involved in cell wall biosynthesis
LSQSAIDILVQDYGVTPSRLRFIPHGAPHVRRIAEAKPKQALGLQDRLVLTTCGLMNPGKGIQYAIDALPALVAEFPEIVYVVAGETHPGVLATSGEAYRGELEAQVERLGLGHNVRFVNRYLSYRELVLHLLATDVYVVPYLDLKQAVSGTMAYALGCGRAIVSTASTYAREVLAEGRGELVEPRDPDSLVQSIGRILRDPAYKNGLQSRAYALGRRMSWSYVGAAYGRAHADICSAEYRVPRVMIEPDWWADGGHAPDPRLSSIDLATLSAPSQTAVPV